MTATFGNYADCGVPDLRRSRYSLRNLATFGATVGLTPVFWSVGLCLAAGGALSRRK